MNVAERAVGKRGSTGENTGRNNATNKGSSEGDTQAFRTLYQENLGVIYRFIYSKVGNREEAEDLTSQVFVKAVRGLDRGRGSQSIQSWLYQVAHTTIAHYSRSSY